MASTAHLHPVALRSTALASSSRAAAAAVRAEATLRGALTDTPRRPPQPSPPPSSRRAADAVMGLTVDAAAFPTLTLREANGDETCTDIRLITAQDYVAMHARYLASAADVDESMVFPWLHCCDQPGTPQAAYFGARGKEAPRYRGLTVVAADADARPRRSTAATASSSDAGHASSACRPRSYSTGSRSTASTASLESAVSSLFDGSLTLEPRGEPGGSHSRRSSATPSLTSSFQGPEPRASLLASSLFPRDVLAVHPRTGHHVGEFLTPKLPLHVNLRLFKHQPAKYATICDIVVYADQGLCDASVSLAELIREAQQRVYRQRGGQAAGAVEYHTYIISDKFETFEEQFGEVVAVDGWGWRRNKVDFVEREREEMCTLTRASEIAHNVWLGNSSDAPRLANKEPGTHRRVTTSHSSSSLATTLSQLDDGNAHGFAVCIEAHDQAKMPSSSLLSSHSLRLSQLESLVSAPDSRSTLLKTDNGEEVWRPQLEDVTHLEVVSTGQVCVSLAQVEELMERMVELCAWVQNMAKGKTDGLSKRVLIYCHDGYTESSLFALAYTMWDRECSLPDAYLYLQLDCNRSFFVYPADVAMLQRLEARMDAIRRSERMDVEETVTVTTTPTQTPRRTFLGGRVAFALSSHKSPGTSGAALDTASGSSSSMSSRERHGWFYDERFDGHFPSRILPHVYLGNLNHASNALMLKALGITHVVSMGESALVPPKSTAAFPLTYRRGASASVSGGAGLSTEGHHTSLWTEWKAGRIQVLDMKGVADDGVDSIKPHMERALAFMESCRLAGGKVLVHCRVGVSRSASIVIAYVMKHLEMDLVSAYLMVRSRRLNILIQPNLLFMWALRRWEAELAVARLRARDTLKDEAEEKEEEEEDDEGRKRSEGDGRLAGMVTWSHFAREVADLNQRYLC